MSAQDDRVKSEALYFTTRYLPFSDEPAYIVICAKCGEPCEEWCLKDGKFYHEECYEVEFGE